MLRSVLVLGLCLSVFWLLPTTSTIDAALAQDCIDYGDYLHWVGGSAGEPEGASALAVMGDYAYVACSVGNQGGLRVLDISVPTSVVIIAKPWRSEVAEPERARSSSIILICDLDQPKRRARSASLYCRSVDSRLYWTWAAVDCRT